jgi:hypothetical protein
VDGSPWMGLFLVLVPLVGIFSGWQCFFMVVSLDGTIPGCLDVPSQVGSVPGCYCPYMASYI